MGELIFISVYLRESAAKGFLIDTEARRIEHNRDAKHETQI
jgi:hypothetical protein